MLIELWGLASTLTLLVTRSSIAKQIKDGLIYPQLARWTTRRGQFLADNIMTLLDCHLCSGFWITLFCALALHVPLRAAPIAYICLVLTITTFDALSKIGNLLDSE